MGESLFHFQKAMELAGNDTALQEKIKKVMDEVMMNEKGLGGPPVEERRNSP